MLLEGKSAVITGAGRGIGAQTALRLAQEGASVVVNYRSDRESAERVVSQIREGGGSAVPVQADVAEEGAAKELVDVAVREFGGLDILVSNAGIEHFGALSEIRKADADNLWAVNITAQLLAAQAGAAAMSEGGSMILTSSVSRRLNTYQHALYAASKAAISSLVRHLARELGERGIRINAIAPGGTATDMAEKVGPLYTPPPMRDLPEDIVQRSTVSLQRYAKPAEIAAVIAFLSSDDASYVTGTTIEADGGMA